MVATATKLEKHINQYIEYIYQITECKCEI